MANQDKLLSAFKEDRSTDFRQLLLCQDIDVDYFYREPDNGTLLDFAIRSPEYKHKKYIPELIQTGAKVWRKDEKTGKLELLDVFNTANRFLLLYEIWFRVYGPSRPGNDSASAIQIAVEENDTEAISLLARSYSIIRGRYPFMHFRELKPPLILLQGSIDAVRLFIKYFDVEKEFQKDRQGRILSCREVLLQKYPELESELPTLLPQEILFLYLEKGDSESFVRRIADISTEILNEGKQKNTSMTYLHVACERNYINVVDALLKKKIVHLNELVPYFIEFAQNVTPIMLAAFNGHYKIFKKLFIQREVELQTAKGSGSVLHSVLRGMQAMQNRNCSTDGHHMILELLLVVTESSHVHTRLNIEHTDEYNRTALHYALKYNNKLAIKLLLRAGAKLYEMDHSELQGHLFLNLQNGDTESFVKLIPFINTEILNDGREKKYNNFTYIHLACECNYINVVDALLKKKIVHLNELVPYFKEFAQNVTPIMLAALKGHYEVFVKLLIIPKVELQTAKGSGSVLHTVLHGMEFTQNHNCSTDGHRMILESLLEVTESGHLHTRLNIEHTDESNKTALHYALKYKNELAIKLLLRAGAKVYEMDQSELQEHLFSYLYKGDTESFVKLIAFISTEILNDGRERNNNFTYLHLACERNYIDVVDALLKKKNVHLNGLVLYLNEFVPNVTSIMLAAFKGHYEIFDKLFILSEVELQTAGGSGSVLHSVLHGMQAMEILNCSTYGHHMILVSLLVVTESEFTQNRNCSTDGHRMILESLLEVTESGHLHTRLNIEHTDESNKTALHYALKYKNELAIKLLLRAGAKVYEMDQSELQEHLFSYLNKGDTESFVKLIPFINTEILNDGREKKYNNFTYLHLACEHNYIDVVDALLKKNVLLNVLVPYFNEFAQNVTPIMVAAVNGHYKIVKKLFIVPEIELQNTGGSGSVLHLVLQGMQFMHNRNCSTDGHRMVLELLLKESESFDYDPPTMNSARINIEHTDSNNLTALHYALKFNNEFAIKLLLKAGAKLYPKDQSVLTSISATIIGRYFDDCILFNRGTYLLWDDEVNSIIFDYKIFTQLDLCSIATKSKGNFFAQFESVTEMRKLFKHPLTKSLLHLKWSLVKKYYYMNLAFYLSFCLTMSTYIFQIQGCLPSSTNFNSSGSNDTAINRDASSIPCDLSLRMWPITLLLYIVLILRELCQFAVSFRRYIGSPENWLEMTTIMVIGFLFANDTSTHLAASAILTSWIGFILLLGKQPSLSIYIEMFKTVALNFAKFLLLYSILIASFAYGFFILFRNKNSGHASSLNQTNVYTTDRTNENWMNSLQNLQMWFFKSIIMMTGEFDASNLPLDSNFNFGHVFFILFVFLVTMVLYNLLNGLAVSDTRAIMEDAEVVALISRAKLISQIERLAISNPFRHCFKCRTSEQIERGYTFLRNKLFDDEILIDEGEVVYVYPAKSNRIEISGEYFGKMPFTIVKHAEEIFEQRQRSKPVKIENLISSKDVTKNNSSERQFANKLVHQFSEQISDLKLEIDAKNAARDEKLLQDVNQRVDRMMNKLRNAVLQEVNLLKNEV